MDTKELQARKAARDRVIERMSRPPADLQALADAFKARLAQEGKVVGYSRLGFIKLQRPDGSTHFMRTPFDYDIEK